MRRYKKGSRTDIGDQHVNAPTIVANSGQAAARFSHLHPGRKFALANTSRRRPIVVL
jgi:hypothetical protein